MNIEERVLDDLRESRLEMDETLQQLQKLKKYLSRLKIKIETLEGILGDSDVDPKIENVEPPQRSQRPVAAPPRLHLANLTAVNAAYLILEASPVPMRVIDIAKNAKANGFGVDLETSKLFKVFYSAISRDAVSSSPRFKKMERGVFGLADRNGTQPPLLSHGNQDND